MARKSQVVEHDGSWFASALPVVSLDAPTEGALLAEAAMLGDGYPEVSCHPADLIADADEMLYAREDVEDLVRRGYRVSAGLIDRISLLKNKLVPLIANQARTVEMSKAQTETAERARVRLLVIRDQLARIGKAAALPGSLFSIETGHTTRLNVVVMKMDEVLNNVTTVRADLADQARVDKLVTEARGLIDEQKASRQSARVLRSERSTETRTQGRIERLLLNAMQVLSAQGLAAYPDDTAREARYRLDHVYGRKASAAGDPGAGGRDGVPDAAGPGGGPTAVPTSASTTPAGASTPG